MEEQTWLQLLNYQLRHDSQDVVLDLQALLQLTDFSAFQRKSHYVRLYCDSHRFGAGDRKLLDNVTNLLRQADFVQIHGATGFLSLAEIACRGLALIECQDLWVQVRGFYEPGVLELLVRDSRNCSVVLPERKPATPYRLGLTYVRAASDRESTLCRNLSSGQVQELEINFTEFNGEVQLTAPRFQEKFKGLEALRLRCCQRKKIMHQELYEVCGLPHEIANDVTGYSEGGTTEAQDCKLSGRQLRWLLATCGDNEEPSTVECTNWELGCDFFQVFQRYKQTVLNTLKLEDCRLASDKCREEARRYLHKLLRQGLKTLSLRGCAFADREFVQGVLAPARYATLENLDLRSTCVEGPLNFALLPALRALHVPNLQVIDQKQGLDNLEELSVANPCTAHEFEEVWAALPNLHKLELGFVEPCSLPWLWTKLPKLSSLHVRNTVDEARLCQAVTEEYNQHLYRKPRSLRSFPVILDLRGTGKTPAELQRLVQFNAQAVICLFDLPVFSLD